jgi:hypothetical protein
MLNKLGKKQAWKQAEAERDMCAACFNASFLLVLFFDPDDGGDMLL